MTSTYAFRDSDVAAERLALVAEIFEPTSRAFLERAGRRGVDVALDLGCGPGHTTRLLAEILRPRRLIGIDSSPAFLARVEGETLCLDATADPVPQADLAYCRFLLSHVREPARAVERWVAALRPGGRLLVEEVASIDTDDPGFADYLTAVRALLADRGNRLEVPLDGGDLVTVAPDPAAVARMFRTNLRAWADEAPDGLDEALAGAAGSIVWTLRQAVYE